MKLSDLFSHLSAYTVVQVRETQGMKNAGCLLYQGMATEMPVTLCQRAVDKIIPIEGMTIITLEPERLSKEKWAEIKKMFNQEGNENG